MDDDTWPTAGGQERQLRGCETRRAAVCHTDILGEAPMAAEGRDFQLKWRDSGRSKFIPGTRTSPEWSEGLLPMGPAIRLWAIPSAAFGHRRQSTSRAECL